ncbi:uncharacterized protein F4822DRAFT_91944 [Hypoxylon trugodes]|uniref:uncharacterized protein n=1 Tax=Hypoxylon trugodes TaxID=326681 RepID=UPI00219DDAA4|nr:uncharacterized protein F4822DRAFT_91944 [Hypoxylon trugodes]KAI1383082.1 hypothetical protein F4822DRAFT_91944 [Hypoxylon trugodes]
MTFLNIDRSRSQYAINDKILRLIRLLILILVLCLSFSLLYPDRDFNLASAGFVLLGAFIQAFDLDCGGVSEISMVMHLCLDSVFALTSSSMLLQLILRGIVDWNYQLTMCLWGGLAQATHL